MGLSLFSSHPRFIMANMGSMITKKLKIAYSIISLNIIFVVNDLLRFKISPKMFFHKKAMFSNVTGSWQKRMSFNTNYYVSANKPFSTLPMGMFFKGIMITLPFAATFKRTATKMLLGLNYSKMPLANRTSLSDFFLPPPVFISAQNRGGDAKLKVKIALTYVCAFLGARFSLKRWVGIKALFANFTNKFNHIRNLLHGGCYVDI